MARGERKRLESGAFLILLGGLVVLAFVAEEAFERLRIPPVLVLIAAGLLLGPASDLLPAKRFAEVAPQFGALAFLLILFEGGLDLDLKEVVTKLRVATTLAAANFALAFLLALAVGVAGKLGVERALAFGILLAPVSGTIVIPLVGRLGLRSGVRTMVVLEAALADVLAVLGMGLLAKVVTGGSLVGVIAVGSLFPVAGSAFVGVAAGLVWPRVVRWLGPRRFVDVLSFGVALSLWGVAELAQASGAISVLVFGMTLANEGPLLRLVGLPVEAASVTARHTVRRMHRFIGELTFLVRTFFFVFLGVVVRFTHLSPSHYLQAGAIFVLFLAGRALVVRVLAARTVPPLSAVERRTVWLLQPRGLVSAVLAIQAAAIGLDSDGTLLGVATLVVLATNILLLAAGRVVSGSNSHP
jgi:Na+:H+ antiporter